MSIVRNSAWNVIGIAVSTLFTIPSLAIYSRQLGVELLGILTLTFSLVGYASSLDLGLSRALVRQVSINIDNKAVVKRFVGTTAIFVAALSIPVTLLIWTGSEWLSTFLNVSARNLRDATTAFHWLSLSISPYVLSLVGVAYFEGKEDFRTSNIIRSITGACNAIGGVICVFVFSSLSSVVAALCLSRWALCIGILAFYRNDVHKSDPDRGRALITFDAAALRTSLRYGGWLTVTNVVGPVMGYFDRFVLSHVSGAMVVAYYTVPSEVISRLLLIPGAISKALFPRLSKAMHNAHSDRRTGTILMFGFLLLTIIPLFAMARWVLRMWMGPEYAGLPADVLRILLVGFFFTSLAFTPFTDLQARGHSKATAYLHLAQVGPYLFVLIFLTSRYGIVGTAWAWTLRTFIDYLLMEILCRRFSGMKL